VEFRGRILPVKVLGYNTLRSIILLPYGLISRGIQSFDLIIEQYPAVTAELI